MFKRSFIYTLTIVCSFALRGQDLVIAMSPFSAETPQEISIDGDVHLRNASTHVINVPLGGTGLNWSIILRRADGSLVKPEVRSIDDFKKGVEINLLLPGQFIVKRFTITNAMEPGDFSLEITASAHGPYVQSEMHPNEPLPPQNEIWSGEVHLAPHKIRVIAAEGEDRTALDYFKSLRSRDLLERETAVVEKYPHSIYTAVFLNQLGPGCASDDVYTLEGAAKTSPEERLNTMDRGGASYVMARASSPLDRSRRSNDPNLRQERISECRNVLERRVKLFRAIEEDRPQFAGIVRIRRDCAFALYLLSRDQEAEDEVRALAKLQGKEAEEARALMKVRNISAEPPKPWWKIW